jgi:hypothetical protein
MTCDDPEHPSSQTIELEAMALLAAARKQYWSHVAEHGCRLPVGTSGTRREMESRLRNEMKEARLKFVAASDQFDQLIGIGLDSTGTADVVLAREQAKRLRLAAFKRYDEALRGYAEFVIGEREPAEGSDYDAANCQQPLYAAEPLLILDRGATPAHNEFKPN